MATKRSVQQRRRARRRAALVLVPTVAGVFVAGTAFAFWTTSGNGTGTGTAGQNTIVTVNGVSTPSNLTPGGAAQAITFSVSNPGTSLQRVSGVTVAVDTVTKASNAPAGVCLPADFIVHQPDPINEDIGAGVTKTYGSSQNASIYMNNTSVNQDGCKGATINLTFTAV